MSAVDVFTVTYLEEPGAPDITVEMFDIEQDAIDRHEEVIAEGIFAVIQTHVFDPLGN